MNGIDAELFKLCFAGWVDALRDHLPTIDGETSRLCRDRKGRREPLQRRMVLAA